MHCSRSCSVYNNILGGARDVGAIAGGVVGALLAVVVLLILVMITVVIILKHYNNRREVIKGSIIKINNYCSL